MNNESITLDNNMFTVRGKTVDECKLKIFGVYGPRAQIWKIDPVESGHLFFKKKEVKVTALVRPIPPPRPMEEEKQKILEEAARQTNSALQAQAQAQPQMQELMRLLCEKLDANAAPAPSNFEHPNLERISELLEQNDFNVAYRKKLLERIRKELSFDNIEDMRELEQRTLEFIGETIGICSEDMPRKLPRVIVLIGPTGVGKTTTAAKLAFSFMQKLEDGIERQVSLITIDLYRLAAKNQLEEYAQILQIPFAAASTAEDLKRELALQKENADIILIDTIGKSPRNTVELAKMKEMLDVCGNGAEMLLAVTAVTKAADIIDITAQFEPFGYKSVIITKLDETNRVGNVISALAERGKSVSYITDGQESTHRTLKKADVIRFLINLEGFEVNRNRLEQRFASRDYGRSS